MAALRKMIHTRKVALIEELGFEAKDAIEDGFDDDGFVLLGDWSNHARSTVLPLRNGELIRTHIAWPDETWSQRAHKARVEDFAESVGASAKEIKEWMENYR